MKPLVFRVHAIQNMFERNISTEDVHHTIEHGEIIREYLDDKPFPSRLVLAWQGKRPLHVVVADDDKGQTIVITAYEPDPFLWDSDFKRKNKDSP